MQAGKASGRVVKSALSELISQRPPLEAWQCVFLSEAGANGLSSCPAPSGGGRAGGAATASSPSASFVAFERPSQQWVHMSVADKAFVIGR